jgi:hypothetical protein
VGNRLTGWAPAGHAFAYVASHRQMLEAESGRYLDGLQLAAAIETII